MSAHGLAPLIGVLVALGGPALLASRAGLGRSDSIATRLLEQAILWLLFATVLAVVLLWEKKPLSSLWLRPLQWQSFAWGLLLAAVMILAVFPIRTWLVRAVGLPHLEVGLEKVLALPIWFRAVAVVTAGVVEETLYHGYALTRVGAFLGSYWLAALVIVPVFALVHLPLWGPGFVVGLLPSAFLSAAFFIWKQDLLAMVVAHIVIDAMGLIVAPPVPRP